MFASSPAVSAAEAVELANDGAVLVDVREPSEFSVGHASPAVSMPLGQLELHSSLLAAADVVLVMCASGVRSRSATRQLRSSGVAATNVKGGLRAWTRAGGPLASGSR
jgi:rhodanese-related sulfurtransferase